MNVSSDQAAAVSTQFLVWATEAFAKPTIGGNVSFESLAMDIDIPNFQGNRISLNWLGAAPQVREWVDEKRPKALMNNDFEVVVKRWEASITIDLDTLNDARWDMYRPRLNQLVERAQLHRYQLLSDLIDGGLTSLCYDGQNFFDTDHSEGESGTQSNELTGSGTSLANVTTDFFAAKAALTMYADDTGTPSWIGNFRPLIWAPSTATMMERFETLRMGGLNGGGNTNVLADQFDVFYDPGLSDANNWAMINPSGAMKPFVNVNREAFHYEDNWSGGSSAAPDVFDRRIGTSSVVGRDAAAYADWRRACMVVNS